MLTSIIKEIIPIVFIIGNFAFGNNAVMITQNNALANAIKNEIAIVFFNIFIINLLLFLQIQKLHILEVYYSIYKFFHFHLLKILDEL